MEPDPTSKGIAEDDTARSSHIRWLLSRSDSSEADAQDCTIPRVVVQFWHDSAAVPSDVQECLDTWSVLTDRGFERVLFHDETAAEFILTALGPRPVSAFRACPHPAMRSDYFRLCYLCSNGGFYVDVDEAFEGASLEHLFDNDFLKAQPLCYDTSEKRMVPPIVFLNEENDSDSWIYYVNNNPILAPPRHPVVELALERATEKIFTRTEYRDIQAITGPGNFTASLVRHSVQCDTDELKRDFRFIRNWESISTTRWPLSYRNDDRNWRIWSSR